MSLLYIPLALLVIAFAGWMGYIIIDVVIPNQADHEDLRRMTCDTNIEEWIAEHPRFIDHQAFARQLFVACELGLEIPAFEEH